MFENINQLEIENESEKEFVKTFTLLNLEVEKHNDELAYTAEQMKFCFKDGFLAGILWWWPVLANDYVGEKSDLQNLVRKEIEPFFCK